MSKRKIAAGMICSVSLIIGIVLSNADHYKSASGNNLRFSQDAMEVMGNAEGCQRDPYLCPANIITQGIGHTGKGTGLVARASDQQIAQWFAEDQIDAQNCIEQNVERKLGKQVPQGVFDGIGSFVFNVGCSKFLQSTMYSLLIRESYIAACNQLPRWVYAGNELLDGLIVRREKERGLCLRIK
ncbi:lysozyme [Candidatus Symbiopectobacterium sp. NZEC127]|uniref:lysozyme n=1 Tax=Candidatus Symbiopectobacterium sp. NZEC127 TaxID=2820472 RepID=UPI0022273F3A|nr:lysozyme [Candidatus Symbiopectobacterium sp. NZEC127]MCW2484830.1 lysozyme [Candidatus Symbiopectobacterium sp. NZEC127]